MTLVLKLWRHIIIWFLYKKQRSANQITESVLLDKWRNLSKVYWEVSLQGRRQTGACRNKGVGSLFQCKPEQASIIAKCVGHWKHPVQFWDAEVEVFNESSEGKYFIWEMGFFFKLSAYLIKCRVKSILGQSGLYMFVFFFFLMKKG